MLSLVDDLAAEGVKLRYLDLGGGLGITYNEEEPPLPSEFAAALKKVLEGRDLKLILEPGRVIVGNAGVMLARVLLTKKGEKNFLITDGAMNDLMRPCLYGSYHGIKPVKSEDRQSLQVDVVGPICESSDFLAKDRELPEMEAGELIAVMSAGAYGFAMSSNYNSRRRAVEVLVKGDRWHIIRRRETYEDLVRGESIPDLQ